MSQAPGQAQPQPQAPNQPQADTRPAPVPGSPEQARAAPAPTAAAPRPAVLEVPARTQLKVALARALATDKDRTGDPWEGTLAEPVKVGGVVAWPRGAAVSGVIAQSAPAGRLKGGQGGLGIRITSVGRHGVETGTYVAVGSARGARNAKFIGGTAALGALVGILGGHGHQADHALGGAVLGAGAGTALAAGTADTVIRIPAGKTVVFTLSVPEKVELKQ